ncbi:unnamed protein product [Lymnaea stagnalis]|uniref:Protein kinase domain-containing protein n=1 Tax=Lymnaea stagnalis TaxID=6523 RepID=A0AAV2HTJ2_LYMST
MVQMLHAGHLSSIIPQTKFYIFSQNKEGHFIDCFTPAHEKCSLKITQVISDGETLLEIYLLGLSFLIQVAELLVTLHKICFVLGDFTNLNFCIDNNMKVHLISVAYLSHISKATSTSTVVTATSAPVNRKKKKSWVVKPVSVDNDLFCFGKMMLSILQLEKFSQSLSLGLAGKDPILVEIKQNLNDTAVHCARIQTNLNDVSKTLRKHLQTITTTYLQEKDYSGNLSKILHMMSNSAEHNTKDDSRSKRILEKPTTPQRPTRPPPKVPETPHMFRQQKTPHMFTQPETPHMFSQPETPHIFSQPETPHMFSQPLPQPPSGPPPLPPRGYAKQIHAFQHNNQPQILPRSKSLGQLLPTNQLSMSTPIMSMSSVSTPSTSTPSMSTSSVFTLSMSTLSVSNLSMCIPSMSTPSISSTLSGISQNQLPKPKPRRTLQKKSLLKDHSESSLCLEMSTSIHERGLFQTDGISKTHGQHVSPDVIDTTGNDGDGHRTHRQQVPPDVIKTNGNDSDGHRDSCASSQSNLSSGSDWLRRTTYDLTRSNQIPPLQQGLNGVYTTNVVFPHEENIAFPELRSPMLSSGGSECGSDSTLFSANSYIVDDETTVKWV